MKLFRRTAEDPAPAPSTSPAETLGGVNARTAAKQRMVLVLLLSVVTLGGVSYIWSHKARPDPASPDKPTAVKISTDDMVGKKLAQKEWVAQSENQLNDANTRLSAVEARVPDLQQMKADLAAVSQENAKLKSDGAKLFAIYEQQNAAQAAQIDALKKSGAAGPGGRVGSQGVEPFRVGGASGNANVAPYPGQTAAAGDDARGLQPGATEVKTISFGVPTAKGTTAKDDGPGFVGARPDAPPTVIEASPEYLPPNSYAPATVIVGVDAGAGVSSQTDPLPVVLRITGPARSVVNNGKILTTRLEGCIVNGAARGDLSAEKVYVKLAKMTCDQPGGRVAVSEVKGFISFGGKTGVRGKVVSREGPLVTQAFLAGIAGGFGRGFAANANAVFSGSTTVVGGQKPVLSPQEIVTAGLGEGMAKSGDMVSKYLIERAEQYQPVIEMPTGIEVEIVFLDGVYVRSPQ